MADQSSHLTRRRLLISATSASVAMAVSATMSGPARADTPQQTPHGIKLTKGSRILFQGDSVTDAGRQRKAEAWTDSNALGGGYPAHVAGQLLGEHPDLELEIWNRGISGNKVPDLAERWQSDAIDLKPTILSILIGINDYWHTIAFGNKYKGTVDDYETGYRDLIKQSLEKIPGVNIVICEPCELRDWSVFDPYRAVARKLADEHKLIFVPFQQVFKDATKAAPSKFWFTDGIHPTPAGHALMAHAWRKAVGV